MRKSGLLALSGAFVLSIGAPALAEPQPDTDTSWIDRYLEKVLSDPNNAPTDKETQDWLTRMQAWIAGLGDDVTEEELRNMPAPPRSGGSNLIVERDRVDQEYRREMEKLKSRPTHDEQFAKELGISVEEFREHERRLAEKTAKNLGIDVGELKRQEEAARLQAAKSKEERLREEARKAVEILNGRDPQLPGSESGPPSPKKPVRPCPPGPGSCVSPQ